MGDEEHEVDADQPERYEEAPEAAAAKRAAERDAQAAAEAKALADAAALKIDRNTAFAKSLVDYEELVKIGGRFKAVVVLASEFVRTPGNLHEFRYEGQNSLDFDGADVDADECRRVTAWFVRGIRSRILGDVARYRGCPRVLQLIAGVRAILQLSQGERDALIAESGAGEGLDPGMGSSANPGSVTIADVRRVLGLLGGATLGWTVGTVMRVMPKLILRLNNGIIVDREMDRWFRWIVAIKQIQSCGGPGGAFAPWAPPAVGACKIVLYNGVKLPGAHQLPGLWPRIPAAPPNAWPGRLAPVMQDDDQNWRPGGEAQIVDVAVTHIDPQNANVFNAKDHPGWKWPEISVLIMVTGMIHPADLLPRTAGGGGQPGMGANRLPQILQNCDEGMDWLIIVGTDDLPTVPGAGAPIPAPIPAPFPTWQRVLELAQQRAEALRCTDKFDTMAMSLLPEVFALRRRVGAPGAAGGGQVGWAANGFRNGAQTRARTGPTGSIGIRASGSNAQFDLLLSPVFKIPSVRSTIVIPELFMRTMTTDFWGKAYVAAVSLGIAFSGQTLVESVCAHEMAGGQVGGLAGTMRHTYAALRRVSSKAARGHWDDVTTTSQRNTWARNSPTWARWSILFNHHIDVDGQSAARRWDTTLGQDHIPWAGVWYDLPKDLLKYVLPELKPMRYMDVMMTAKTVDFESDERVWTVGGPAAPYSDGGEVKPNVLVTFKDNPSRRADMLDAVSAGNQSRANAAASPGVIEFQATEFDLTGTGQQTDAGARAVAVVRDVNTHRIIVHTMPPRRWTRRASVRYFVAVPAAGPGGAAAVAARAAASTALRGLRDMRAAIPVVCRFSKGGAMLVHMGLKYSMGAYGDDSDDD